MAVSVRGEEELQREEVARTSVEVRLVVLHKEL